MFIGRSPNWCEVNVVFREKERKEERESENDLKRESENEKAREREIRFNARAPAYDGEYYTPTLRLAMWHALAGTRRLRHPSDRPNH